MAKSPQSPETQAEKKPQKQPAPSGLENEVTPADSLVDRANRLGGGDINSQAASLGRLQAAQQQAILRKAGRIHGNQHVQRLAATLQKETASESGSKGQIQTPARNSRPRLALQTKLSVNEPDDQYEQEADQVAETVMKMPAPATPPPEDDKNSLSRFPLPQLQAKSSSTPQVSTDLENRIQSMKGGGHPLPDSERTFFEPRMGVDLSGVRIHTHETAVQTAQDLQARAYTVGSDVAFKEGEYAPGTTEGRRLLGHELTHVVQQGAARPLQRHHEGQDTFLETTALQRQEDAAGAEEAGPTEEQKAAAKAAAQAAEQIAAQAASQGKQEVAKSKTEQAGEKQTKQAASQEAAGAKAAAASAKGEIKKGIEGEDQPTTKGKGTAGKGGPKAAAETTPAANGAGPGKRGLKGKEKSGTNGKAPASPEEDPAFQGVVTNIKGAAAQQQAHPPAKTKADEAQAAAEAPASEIEGKAQANKVGEMEQVETPAFDAAAFKAQLMDRIAALAPKNVREADEFKEGDKLGSVKGEMQGKVAEEQAGSQAPLEEKAAEAPDTGSVPPKPVSPLSPADPGAPPPGVGADQAAPKPKGQSEVEAPLQENSQKLDQQMAEADITEEQLEKSNEPEFQSALGSKKEAQTQAQQAPQEYRQEEQGQLAGAEAEAATMAQEKTQAMHGDRAQLLGQVEGQQGQTKSQDEKAREAVGAKIQGIYNQTKTQVEATLNKLDEKVNKAFDEGAAAAKKAFEDFVDAKMEAYKQERYGGWLGWARWAKDKLLGMPGEVNVFYQEGRQLYLEKMDAVIDNVVEIIGAGLTQAKAEIAKGKKEIQDYVNELPENLQEVGQQAAQDIQGKFAELEQSVDNKQNELIDKLANKYQENLKAIDARIEELKAANQGLVDKAINAVAGVIKTIIELKNMLMSVLAKAADAIGKIIKDPIGFLGNLISGVKQGLMNFVANIGTHLKKGLMTWLFGEVAKAGIQLPESFDLKGILTLVMQVLGLTWANIRMQAVKLLGEKVVGYLEGAFEIFTMIKDQGLGALWEYIKDQLSDLKTMVIDGIKDMVITQVIQAGVQWLIGILGGPAGAFIKAAKAIYDIVMWFINNGSQVMSLISAIIDSVSAIAGGAVSAAAKFIEEALAKALPVVIGFLASLLGLGNLSQKIKGIIQKIQEPINKAIGWVLSKAKAFAKKIGGALGFGKEEKKKAGTDKESAQPKDKEIGEDQQFVSGGKTHRLWVEEHGGKPDVMVASTPTELKSLLNSPRLQELMGKDPGLAADVSKAKSILGLTDNQIEAVVQAARGGDQEKVEKADESLEKQMQDLADTLKRVMYKVAASRKPATIAKLLSESNTEQVFKPGETQRLSGEEILAKLRSISAALVAEDKSNTLIRSIRKEWEYGGSGGVIYAPFVEDQVEAVSKLASNLEGDPELPGSKPKYLFSLERGGSLLGSQLTEGRDTPHIRIRKVTDKAELEALGHEGHHAQQRAELMAKVEEVMAGQPKDQIITLAVAETSVSGSSALGLAGALRELTNKYPNLDITYLILQQTMQLEKDEQARETQRVTQGKLRPIARGGRIQIVVQNTSYILGEDVDYQAAPASKRSIIVFKGTEEQLVAYEIRPEGETTSRDIVIDLGQGAYNGQLPGVL